MWDLLCSEKTDKYVVISNCKLSTELLRYNPALEASENMGSRDEIINCKSCCAS